MASSFCTALHLQASNRNTSHRISTAFLVRVTNIHCESVFLNTFINGMLLPFIAYHRTTHVVEIPWQLVVLDSFLSSTEHISRLFFPISSTTNALMSVPVLFVSSLPFGTRPHTIFMNIFLWKFSRVTFYKISQYCQTQRYKAVTLHKICKYCQTQHCKAVGIISCSAATMLFAPHQKSRNNPLYTAQYAASWGSNLCGVQDLPELMKQS